MTRFIRLAVGACVAGAGLLGRSARRRTDDVQRRHRPAEPDHRHRLERVRGDAEAVRRQARGRGDARQHHLLDRRPTGSCIGRREHRERDRSRRNRRTLLHAGATGGGTTFLHVRHRPEGRRRHLGRLLRGLHERHAAEAGRRHGRRRARRRRCCSSSRRRTRRPSTSPTRKRRRSTAAAPATRTIAGFTEPARHLLPRPELGHADHRREEHRLPETVLVLADLRAEQRRTGGVDHWRHELPDAAGGDRLHRGRRLRRQPRPR